MLPSDSCSQEKVKGVMDHVVRLHDYILSMSQLHLSDAEYAYLKAFVLFSPGVFLPCYADFVVYLCPNSPAPQSPPAVHVCVCTTGGGRSLFHPHVAVANCSVIRCIIVNNNVDLSRVEHSTLIYMHLLRRCI